MEEKKILILLTVLVQKIADLELELSLTKYERDELKREKESLKKGEAKDG